MNTRTRGRLPPGRTVRDYLAQALRIVGGHLFLGGGGWFLHFAAGATLQGYDLPAMKALCTEAGLPVIDILYGEHRLARQTPWPLPMVAVGRPACPQPWSSASFAPLPHVAALWAATGAEIINLPARS